jgi:hypothetical protein
MRGILLLVLLCRSDDIMLRRVFPASLGYVFWVLMGIESCFLGRTKSWLFGATDWLSRSRSIMTPSVVGRGVSLEHYQLV